MNKILLSAVLLAGLALSAHADIIYPDGFAPRSEPYAIKKISRGIVNTVLFALEIPKAMFDAGQSEGILDSQQISLTLTRGPHKAMERLQAGVYDLATAFESNKPLLHLEPEYINPSDVLPGFNQHFGWEGILSPAMSPSFRY
jgi:hypothetical protein